MEPSRNDAAGRTGEGSRRTAGGSTNNESASLAIPERSGVARGPRSNGVYPQAARREPSPYRPERVASLRDGSRLRGNAAPPSKGRADLRVRPIFSTRTSEALSGGCPGLTSCAPLGLTAPSLSKPERCSQKWSAEHRSARMARRSSEPTRCEPAHRTVGRFAPRETSPFSGSSTPRRSDAPRSVGIVPAKAGGSPDAFVRPDRGFGSCKSSFVCPESCFDRFNCCFVCLSGGFGRLKSSFVCRESCFGSSKSSFVYPKGCFDSSGSCFVGLSGSFVRSKSCFGNCRVVGGVCRDSSPCAAFIAQSTAMSRIVRGVPSPRTGRRPDRRWWLGSSGLRLPAFPEKSGQVRPERGRWHRHC